MRKRILVGIFAILFILTLFAIFSQEKSEITSNIIKGVNNDNKIESVSLSSGGGASKIPTNNNPALSNKNSEIKDNKKLNEVDNPPFVELIEPSDNSIDNDGDIKFVYVVQDGGLLRDCVLYHNIYGEFSKDNKNKNSLVQPNRELHFSLRDVPNGNYQWNVVCEDEFHNKNSNENFSFSVNKISPTVSNIPDLSLKEDGMLELNLSKYFSDKKGDKLTYEAEETSNIKVKINDEIAIIEPNKNWFGIDYIRFKAFDEHGLEVSSNIISIIVSQEGDTVPRFISTRAKDGEIDNDGYVFVECNVTDDIGLKEVSLYSDTSGIWELEETKTVSGLEVSVEFNIEGLLDGKYEWACSVKDINEQETMSERQNVEVDINVELEHGIPSVMVNNIDTNRYVTISYSSYLENSIALGNLIIKKFNGDIYYNKDFSEVDCIKDNINYMIVCPHKFRVKPSEIFVDGFKLGNVVELDFDLEYFIGGEKYSKQVVHKIEVVESV